MFHVRSLDRGDCDNNESHGDRDVLFVEDLVTKQSLRLCPKCFIAQLKLRSKGKTEEPPWPSPGPMRQPEVKPAAVVGNGPQK